MIRRKSNIFRDSAIIDEDLQEAIFEKKKKEDSKAAKIAEFEKDPSIRAFKTMAKYMDDYYLDPIIGLVPVVGDAFGSVISLYSVTVALFKVRSIPLALAMLLNALIDFALGLIPTLGIVADIFFKANRRNYKLLYGYVSGDEKVISSINKRALSTAIGIIGVSYIIYSLIRMVFNLLSSMWEFVLGVFS